MSFGSEQFNQHFIEEKEEKDPFPIEKEEKKSFPIEKDGFFKEKQGFIKEKSAFYQENEVFAQKFVESETESQKKENSLQNSKLKDQIVKKNYFL